MINKIENINTLLGKEYFKQFYLLNHFKDFLNNVNYQKNSKWEDTWDYFSNLYLKDYSKLNLIQNKIINFYNLDENIFIKIEKEQENFILYYSTNKKELDLFIEEKLKNKKIINYNDFISELFPSNNEFQRSSTTITFQVTNNCNLKCSYCYQHNKNNNIMPFENAQIFVNKILNNELSNYINLNNTKALIIEFIGGEPWLCIDLIEQISNYFINQLFLKKSKFYNLFRFSICSNGLLHFDPKVQKYILKHNNHLSYNITIDGNKELHDKCRLTLNGEGSYDKAILAVNDYKTTFNGIMGSKMTLSPENISYTFSALKGMIEQGYCHINLNCVYEEGWTNEHAKILYQELKKLTNYLKENNLLDKTSFSILSSQIGQFQDSSYTKNWCGGTGAMLAMDYKGDLYPCIRYMESSLGKNQKPYIIGNIFQGITEQNKIVELNNITRQSQSDENCLSCPISSGCAWCSAYNYEIYGTPNKRATFICIMHKARVLACKYYFNIKNEPFKMNLSKEEALKIIDEKEYNDLIKGEK